MLTTTLTASIILTWTVRHHDLTSETLADVSCELEHLPNWWCHLWNRLRLCEKILHRYDVTGWLHCEVLRWNIMHPALFMQTWYQSFVISNTRLDVFAYGTGIFSVRIVTAVFFCTARHHVTWQMSFRFFPCIDLPPYLCSGCFWEGSACSPVKYEPCIKSYFGVSASCVCLELPGEIFCSLYLTGSKYLFRMYDFLEESLFYFHSTQRYPSYLGVSGVWDWFVKNRGIHICLLSWYHIWLHQNIVQYVNILTLKKSKCDIWACTATELC